MNIELKPGEQQLLIAKGIISELPEESQKIVKALEAQLTNIVNREDGLGMLAFALVGLKTNIK